ncbi:MAG: hypothetical protein R2753_01000 [Chitinophagales bacterium]
MKSKLMITMVVALALFSSCEQIPDLNPSTSAGSNILVANINEALITENDFENRDYDITGDGTTDISFSRQIRTVFFSDEVTHNLYMYSSEILLDLNGIPYYGTQLSSAPALGAWFPFLGSLSNTTTNYNEINYNIPNGKRYIFYRMYINNAQHYGWIELQSSTTNGLKNTAILRIAIAEEPGIVLRAGQTE